MYRQSNALSKELARANSPTNHLWDLGDRNTLERMKEKKHRPPKQKPMTLAQSNFSSISPTKIHKPRLLIIIINTSRYESPWVTVSSPLLLQTHTIHTQQRTEQARSAYSEPQGLKFCLWEIWELSWERDMATGSFLLLEKCNWLKPNCTKLHGFLTTSVKQSQTVSKQMVLMTAKAQKEGKSHPLKPSPAVWGPNCCVCDLCCIKCRSLSIRNSIWCSDIWGASDVHTCK